MQLGVSHSQSWELLKQGCWVEFGPTLIVHTLDPTAGFSFFKNEKTVGTGGDSSKSFQVTTPAPPLLKLRQVHYDRVRLTNP
jgi:hypothetical protein